jgi:predicted O-methyltransferase YrrM
MGFEIQPDDVLILSALIKTCNIKTILELGGLDGYSARCFCEAGAKVWSVDVNTFSIEHPQHIMLTKNILELMPEDIGNNIDMVFFDAHCYGEQTECLKRFKKVSLITDNTFLVFHDTGGTKIHQISERLMVNDLVSNGYSCLNIKTERGLSICCKTKLLDIV